MYLFCYVLRVIIKIDFLISKIVHLYVWNAFFYKTSFIGCASWCNISQIFQLAPHPRTWHLKGHVLIMGRIRKSEGNLRIEYQTIRLNCIAPKGWYHNIIIAFLLQLFFLVGGAFVSPLSPICILPTYPTLAIPYGRGQSN